MDYREVHDIVALATRILFLLGGPVVLGIAAAGLCSGLLQGVTTIKDDAIGYAFRLLAFIAVLYLMLPLTIDELVGLGERAFGP